MAARRAELAPHRGSRAASPVHACAAPLTVQELAQQVVLRWRTGLDDARAPGTHFLHAIEQLFGDDRLVQPADGAVLASQTADVAAIGTVEKDLAHRVLRERPVFRRTRPFRIQPRCKRTVGLLSTRVPLEQLAHERSALRIGHGERAFGITAVTPRQRADEVSLPSLLAQAGPRPERERDRVVLVEHLVDRLSEERGRIAVILSHRLRDREDLDPQPLAEHLLVTPRLDLVPREPRGVVDEHAVEPTLGSVRHETLELRPPIGALPPRVEVAVLADERQPVLGGERTDRFALRIGREALTQLVGRLANVGDRTRRWLRRHAAPRLLLRRRVRGRA